MAVSELEQVAWRCFYASAQPPEFANSNSPWRDERREGDCTFKSWLVDDYFGFLVLHEDASVEVVVKHMKKLLEMHHPD